MERPQYTFKVMLSCFACALFPTHLKFKDVEDSATVKTFSRSTKELKQADASIPPKQRIHLFSVQETTLIDTDMLSHAKIENTITDGTISEIKHTNNTTIQYLGTKSKKITSIHQT